MTEIPDASPAAAVRALAEELVQLSQSDPEAMAAKVAALSPRQQAELSLRLPPAERMQLLLHSPKPMRAVRALPDAEFYLTVRDIGPGEALPLLALASPEQTLHLMDLESWRIDRFDPDRSGAWIALLVEAGEPALRRFVRNADDEVLVLLIQGWIRPKEIEYDDMPDAGGHGLSEGGDSEGFVSPDGNYRFQPEREEHGPAAARFLQMLFTEQAHRYLKLVSSATWTLPSEIEEEALRWRQSRLEEHGYPDWDQAFSIYAPPGDVRKPDVETPAAIEARQKAGAIPVSRAPLRLGVESGWLAPALERLDGPNQERVLRETIAVANRILIADRMDTGNRDAHRAALKKAAGYLQIAFEERNAQDPGSVAQLLTERPMLDWFREGHRHAAELQGRARRFFEQSWPAGVVPNLELLDSPIRERLAGLLEERPLYVSISEIDASRELRPFTSLEEIAESRIAMDLAELLGRIFIDRLGVDPAAIASSNRPERAEPVRFSTLMLTLLAWHGLTGEWNGAPLPAPILRRFIDEIASRKSAPKDAAPLAMERLLGAVDALLGSDPRERSLLEGFGRFSLELLQEQCGALDAESALDPRYLPCLLLEPSVT